MAKQERKIPAEVLRARPHSLWLVPREASVDLYVREDEFMAARYPPRPTFDVQLGVWDDKQVVCIALLVRIAGLDAGTFDRWINVADPQGLRLVQLLAGQSAVELFLVTDRVAQSLRRPNNLLGKAAKIVKNVRTRKMWSEEGFQQHVERLDTLYPSSVALWWAAREQGK